jgi:hypothetical protein
MKTKIAHLPPKRLAPTTVSPDHRVGLLAQSPGRPRPNLIGARASWVPWALEVSGNCRPSPQVAAGFVDIIEAVRGMDTATSLVWLPGLQPRPRLIDTAVSL